MRQSTDQTIDKPWVDVLLMVIAILITLAVMWVRDGLLSTSQTAIALPDMTSECLKCSQEHETDACLPSLCVKRKNGLLCCVERKNPR